MQRHDIPLKTLCQGDTNGCRAADRNENDESRKRQ
jgi:hypothetical protein